jgi:hypothetical protein
MSLRRSVVAAVAVVVFVSGALGLALAVQDDEKALPAEAGDLAAASVIELRDAGGQVVLSGRFGEAGTDDDDGGDVERKADLTATSGGARGEAEIEISAGAGRATKQKLEVEVEGLTAGSSFTVVVDGRSVATITADPRGKADVELSTPRAK